MKEKTGDGFDLYKRPSHLINRAARLLARVGEVRLRKIGLAVAQLPVLYMLKDGSTLSQKELAEQVRIEQPTMAQLLARMERDGLIQRTPHPQDKRSSLISLTELAMDKLPAGREVLFQGNAEALQGFSADEVEMLAQLLRRVINNLEAMADQATPESEESSEE